MRFSFPSEKRYAGTAHYEGIDKRENAEMIREINLKFVPRAPAGGGGGGGRGGGGGGGGSRGGSSGGGSSGGSRGGVSFSGSSGSRGASSYGRGGGSPTTIASGSTFAGRSIGGGSREQVYGNSRYGSGYTYGGGSSVAGRGFPFGYWPVFVPVGAGAGYYGYREYGPANNSSRPGGPMQQALIRSSEWPPENGGGGGGGGNTTTPINNATASYYIVGDADSVAAVMEALVSSCSVVNASGTAVDDNNSTVHVEQAVQYYRSSSFMLALTSYNNTASLPSNAPADNSTEAPPPSADTPLPAGTNTTFLTCLNNTIGAAVPIMDAAPGPLNAAGSLNLLGMMWLVLWLLKMF